MFNSWILCSNNLICRSPKTNNLYTNHFSSETLLPWQRFYSHKWLYSINAIQLYPNTKNKLMNQLLMFFLCNVYLIDSWIRRSTIYFTKIHTISNQIITDIPHQFTNSNPYINMFLISLHISYIMIDPICIIFITTIIIIYCSIYILITYKLWILLLTMKPNYIHYKNINVITLRYPFKKEK